MNAAVTSITPGSPASGLNISPGDILCKINGHIINDVLDYQFYSYDSRLSLEFKCPDGSSKPIKVNKPEGSDIGLTFETFLMDDERSCKNKCIFCFIDQLPKSMRSSLYHKDDDFRMSFFQGYYITLTNLSPHDVKRIIKLRISPLFISVHTLDPTLRSYMLGGEKGGEAIGTLKKLANAGITLNCQIVCCPGVNDGRELSKTIEEFIKLGECINSVSIVPVGLTKHRQGLTVLRSFDKDLALQTVLQVGEYGEKCLKSRGSRVFYCADELFIQAGLELPPTTYYEDYPQLENGVGLISRFITEFDHALAKNKSVKTTALPKSLVTGTLAYPYLKKLLLTAEEKYGTIKCKVYAIRNDFFGESVTVSGLITGGDIITQLNGVDMGTELLIPQNMLRHGEDIFLDNITISDVSEALNIPIRIVNQNGADLFHALMEENNG
jgi:putative radical SAM enzyme (TIGR03279 family)